MSADLLLIAAVKHSSIIMNRSVFLEDMDGYGFKTAAKNPAG